MTFKEFDTSEIKREDKRTREPGKIVQDVKKIITPTEIGKATVTKVDTPACDQAEQAVSEDIKKHDKQNGR